MAKLIDELEARVKRAGGPRELSKGHGGPCPICDGERNVAVYFRFSVNGPNVGQGLAPYNAEGVVRTGKHNQMTTKVVLPGAQQGMCLECATAVYLEVAERIGRYDRVRAMENGDGKDQG